MGLTGAPEAKSISSAVSQIWTELPAAAEKVKDTVPLPGAWTEVMEIVPARSTCTVSQCPPATWTVTLRPRPPFVISAGSGAGVLGVSGGFGLSGLSGVSGLSGLSGVSGLSGSVGEPMPVQVTVAFFSSALPSAMETAPHWVSVPAKVTVFRLRQL